jgi:predicted homoserine dehydrogenase-like protein
MTGEGASMSRPLRIGVVGASKIAIRSVLAPARVLPGIEVAAVSARDPGRPKAYAAEHGIGRVYPSYAEMLRDSAIDLAVSAPRRTSMRSRRWARSKLASRCSSKSLSQ